MFDFQTWIVAPFLAIPFWSLPGRLTSHDLAIIRNFLGIFFFLSFHVTLWANFISPLASNVTSNINFLNNSLGYLISACKVNLPPLFLSSPALNSLSGDQWPDTILDYFLPSAAIVCSITELCPFPWLSFLVITTAMTRSPPPLPFTWSIQQLPYCQPLIHPMGFPGGTSGKAFTCQCRRCKRCRLDPWGQERYPGVGNGNSLQYSCLENPLDREEPGWGYKESDMTETKHKLKGTNAFNVSSTLQRVIILNANLTLQLACLFSVAESLHLLKIFIYLFIWLCQVWVAACDILSLCCSIQDLFLFSAWSCGMQGLAPGAGIKPGLLYWEHRVLTTGLPGKYPS